MKINSKKTLLVLAAVALVGGTFTAVALTKENGFSVSAAEDENTIWKHYAAVAPDPDKKQFGSKEFWANCSEIGTHVFEAPTIGKIQDGGDFSKTAYFKELTPEDDRYVPYEYTVTFDSNGAAAIDPVTVGYGKTLTAPVTPTRAEDAYYKAYTFDAWYVNGKAFDVAKDTIKENITLTAGWKYGEAKIAYVNDWNKADFAKTGSADTSFGGIGVPLAVLTWGHANAAEEKVELTKQMADLGITDETGMWLNSRGKDSTLQIPAMNFVSLLDSHPVIYMPVGDYNNNQHLLVNAGKTGTLADVTRNGGSEQGFEYCQRTLLAFTKDGSGKVHMHFTERTFNEPYKEYERRDLMQGDVILADEQANGTEGLIFNINQGGSRLFFIGRPYAFAGEKPLVNIAAKTGFTVEGGNMVSRDETNSADGRKVAPYGQWYELTGEGERYMGMLGSNQSGPSTITFDPINFTEHFAKGEGVKFVIGAWNGSDTISYVGTDGKDVNFGSNGVKPDDPVTHTRLSIENTWRNWAVSIDRSGMVVENKFEGKTYRSTLSDKQLKGEESLVFKFSKRSNQHFFLISNIDTYHI